MARWMRDGLSLVSCGAFVGFVWSLALMIPAS